MTASHVKRALVVAALTTPCFLAAAPQNGQAPTFRAGVETIAVDVEVMDRDGKPITTLHPEDFDVSINNHARRVVSADLVQYSTRNSTGAPGANDASIVPVTITPGKVPAESRVYALAVDELSFSAQAMPAWLQTARKFIDQLRPEDIVGLYVYPTGGRHIDFTHSHADIKRALDHVVGKRDPTNSEYHLTTSDVIDIVSNSPGALAHVLARECGNPFGEATLATGGSGAACGVHGQKADPELIDNEAQEIAMQWENNSAQSLYGLGTLMNELRVLPGRKTVVVMSGGMIAGDQVGARPDPAAMMRAIGQQASESDVNLYVLHLDNSFFDSISVDHPAVRFASDAMVSQARDSQMLASGLEALADAAGGELIKISAGTGELGFNRILRETTAYYLLGVEPLPVDHNGRPLYLHVKAKTKGVTVRSHKEAIIR